MIGKDLEPSLNHSKEEPTSNWLQRKGRLTEIFVFAQSLVSWIPRIISVSPLSLKPVGGGLLSTVIQTWF